jgi:uracil-DNA glycosylase family 4
MNTDDLYQCRKCPRLNKHLHDQRESHPQYHNRPVAALGADNARLLIVGLAPGLHGANASGKPFHGDASGDFLWAALHASGFAREKAHGHWQPQDCRITNAVKCLPPQNRPTSREITRCNSFLKAEIQTLSRGGAILALGHLAHGALLKALGLVHKHFPFRHGIQYDLPSGISLFDSYHCSRYNTQTGRLTRPMFDQILANIKRCLE